MKFQIKLPTKAVISISVIIALVMIISSFIELNQSKKEIYQLLSQHSETLLQSIIINSENTLNTGFEIEDLITEKLLSNARLIRKLDSLNAISKDELIKIANENQLYRINIFDRNGNRVLSNRIPEPEHIHGEENINRFDELKEILLGNVDEYVIGLKKAEFSDAERYAVAVARANRRGAIVVNLDADDFLRFRKKIGIGTILQSLASNHGIDYIILQDSLGILAATEIIDSVESIVSSEFLSKAVYSDSSFSREIKYKDKEIFEIVKRFNIDDEFIGIYRLGLEMEDIRNVEQRMIRRVIIISLLLAAIAIIVLSIVFTNQNLKSISEEYKRFKTFASSVLENMNESVIVIDKSETISFLNLSAEKLFGIEQEKLLGKNLSVINRSFAERVMSYLLQETNKSFEILYYQNGIEKVLLCGLSRLDELKDKEFCILVIQDITENKHLEEQAKRNEKLTAMGELASGVAHEIRNPINAIGMIAQRLQKEFKVIDGEEDYKTITQLLRNEVNRINKIITQFLNYAKPIELNLTDVDVEKFISEIHQLFLSQAKEKKIQFTVSKGENIIARFDTDLIKQTLINILQNAFDAVNEGGKVRVAYYSYEKNLVFEISDTGSGIPQEHLNKIFDLYFTTKKDGNGLGLSIAQKIINQHNGKIVVSSIINEGTTFKVILPL